MIFSKEFDSGYTKGLVSPFSDFKTGDRISFNWNDNILKGTIINFDKRMSIIRVDDCYKKLNSML